MKKKTLVASFGLMVSSLTFAGGLLTNTNQNVAFLRNPARDGAIGIDGVYSNPAGVAFLPDGLHLSLNFQSAYQTREITSVFGPFAYGAGNRGESSKLFKGDAKAPVVPSLQAAYNRGRWSYSFNFAIGGGGGKCAFEDGLGSFESQAALLPLLGSEMGINSYSLDSYMRGRQYYYGFQIGAAYKITDNLSAFVGGRLVYATTNYYGYVKNISVNNPVGGEMVGASALFAGQMASYLEQAGQLTAAAEQAAAAGNQDLAQQYAELAQKAGAAAKQMGTLAVATEDVTLNCDQTGWGFTPIIGLDYKIGKFNFGAKYEFKTKIRLDNRAANSESAERLAMLDKFRDGRTVDPWRAIRNPPFVAYHGGVSSLLRQTSFAGRRFAKIVEERFEGISGRCGIRHHRPCAGQCRMAEHLFRPDGRVHERHEFQRKLQLLGCGLGDTGYETHQGECGLFPYFL